MREHSQLMNKKYNAQDVLGIRALIDETVTGKVIPKHDVFGHHYLLTWCDKIVDSVTTKNILDKPHLLNWATGLAVDYLVDNNKLDDLKDPEKYKDTKLAAQLQWKDIRDDAGTVGTVAHDCIEQYVIEWIKTGKQPEDVKTFFPGKLDDIDKRSIASARAAEQVFIKYNCVPISTELLVGSERRDTAGTLDMLVLNLDTEEIEVWDWKTSNAIDDFYAIQASIYADMFTEMTGIKVPVTRVFKIDKWSDKFHEYIIPDMPAAVEAFEHLSMVYNYWTSKEKKIIKNIKKVTL